jgi:methyl-accepting chemotaxis protein
MQTILHITQNIAEIILRLEQRSADIGRILDVIDEVADQTSMLSLNASIIAAQAGVHGRGLL